MLHGTKPEHQKSQISGQGEGPEGEATLPKREEVIGLLLTGDGKYYWPLTAHTSSTSGLHSSFHLPLSAPLVLTLHPL
jgi:hypothetical protein